MHKAVQSSRQCPKFITTLQEKNPLTRWSARWRVFFLASLLFPHALLALHLCRAHGAAATAQCAVIWSSFLSLSHFFALHFGGGGVLRLSTLPAVVSTRWFPFVAFVCGCSQNMCMSSDVCVTKRQLVAAAKKTAYRGTGGVRRVLVSARMEKSIRAGGEDRSAQEEDTLNLSSRSHTQNDKNLAVMKQATSPVFFHTNARIPVMDLNNLQTRATSQNNREEGKQKGPGPTDPTVSTAVGKTKNKARAV